jgi:Golgi to ER traffic protein 4
MSAAAARRRKQLAARKASSGGEQPVLDSVSAQLDALLSASPDIDEATAYEALQLAQSLVRKRVKEGQYGPAADLAYTCSATLLKSGRLAVASQLLTVLVEVLRETHAEESPTWLDRLDELQALHKDAIGKLAASPGANEDEVLRLQRLQLEWLRSCVSWSADLGPTNLGNYRLHHLLSIISWELSLEEASEEVSMEEPDEDWVQELQIDAVQHAAIAEKPDQILAWLATLDDPTPEQTKAGHKCPPSARDGLLTRAVLAFVCLENLRDANVLVRGYLSTIEKRTATDLATSYTSKEDGQAPSHVMFCSMLLRVCEKDARTGPLFSWLIRSFRREMELMYKPNSVLAYTVKIGKIYFNIQPPPSMLNTLENMMGMMGGGGMGGINPAMMQAAMAQMQGGMM